MSREPVLLGSAVAAAFAASLCCIGPLLAVLFGVGAFGAATLFEPLRPYLLGAAAIALVFGFYRVYFRRADECAPGQSCSVRPGGRGLRRALWAATVAVCVFAATPYVIGPLAERAGNSPQPTETPGSLTPHSTVDAATTARSTLTATLGVEGMTCASCETAVKLALSRTEGVRSVTVSYERGEAIVAYDPTEVTPHEIGRLLEEKTGYRVAAEP